MASGIVYKMKKSDSRATFSGTQQENGRNCCEQWLVALKEKDQEDK